MLGPRAHVDSSNAASPYLQCTLTGSACRGLSMHPIEAMKIEAVILGGRLPAGWLASLDVCKWAAQPQKAVPLVTLVTLIHLLSHGPERRPSLVSTIGAPLSLAFLRVQINMKRLQK